MTAITTKTTDTDSYWMLKHDLQEAKTDLPYEECFRMFCNEKNFKETKIEIINVYEKIIDVLDFCVNDNVVLLHHYNWRNKDSAAAKNKLMKDKVLNWYRFRIYAAFAKIREEIIVNPVFTNLEFFLACVFPAEYSNEHTLSLSMLFSDIRFDPIYVCCDDIIRWNTLIMSLINVEGLSKDGVPIYYKSWMTQAQLMYCYSQICKYIVTYLQKFQY